MSHNGKGDMNMNLRVPDVISIYGNDGVIENVSVNGSGIGDVELSANIEDGVLSAFVIAENTPLKRVEFKWILGDGEIRRDNIKVFGDAWERGYGDLEWKAPDLARMMPWFFMVSNGSDSVRDYTDRKTDCFGVRVRPHALCSWTYDNKEITLYMDIRNGSEGVELGGRKLHLADVIFSEYKDISAFESGEKFCREMCTDPIMMNERVYGFNDWYYAYGKNTADRIFDDAKKLAELTDGNSQKAYVVIDSGWEINACDGPWRVGNEKFPDMARLARDISDLGLIPGIWIRPLKQSKPDEKVKDSWKYKEDTRFLDPSNPEVLDYIAEQMRRIVKWGYKLIKYDFVSVDILRKYGFQNPAFYECQQLYFHDKTLTTAEIILNMYKRIREASKGAVLIGCNTIGHLCAGLVEVNRTGDDTSGREWERTRKMGVNTLAFRMMQHKAFYMADADCVGITSLVPWSLNSRWLKILSESGSPLFISWDRSFCSEEIENAVKTALRRNSDGCDKLLPLDWMETVTPAKWLLNGDVVEYDWDNE